MNKAYDFLVEPIRRNFAFFLMIFMLGFIPAFIDILLHENPQLMMLKIAGLLGYVFFVSYVIVLVCANCLGRILKYIIGVVWIFAFLVDLFLLVEYESLMAPSFILVLFNTNLSEVREYLSTMSVLPNVLKILLFLIFFFCCIWKISQIRIKEPSKNKFYCFIFTVLFLCWGAGIFAFSCKRLPAIISYRLITPIERIAFSTFQTIQDVSKMNDLLENSRFQAPTIVRNNSKIKNIVVILGESLSRTKMASYGYYLPTTPRLEERRQSGDVFLFSDVITPYGITAEAVKHIMTSNSNDDWLHNEVLSDVMEKVGYTSYWLSNQESFGVFANIPALIAHSFDVTHFTRVRNSTEDKYGLFDDHLLPIVKDVLKDSSEKRFMVIHLMGNHTRYKYRYPASYNIFSSSDIRGKKGNKAEVLAEYANSVLYNDFVVDQIIKLFEDKEALVIYLSDHGEELYDFRDFIGHGITMHSSYMAEIPFIVYLSEPFKKAYPEKTDQIKNSIDNSFMTDDFYNSILDIADIGTTISDSTRGIFNPSYKAKKRIFNGVIDYDKSLKNKN